MANGTNDNRWMRGEDEVFSWRGRVQVWPNIRIPWNDLLIYSAYVSFFATMHCAPSRNKSNQIRWCVLERVWQKQQNHRTPALAALVVEIKGKGNWQISISGICVGCGHLPVTVTTRIIPLLVGDPHKPLFATVTGRGPDPKCVFIFSNDAPSVLRCHQSHQSLTGSYNICTTITQHFKA